jgi:tetratricopeptide (TPR) repeat protein
MAEQGISVNDEEERIKREREQIERERKTLQEFAQSLEDEKETVLSIKEELVSKEKALNAKEHEIEKRYEDVNGRLSDLSLREKEMEDMAYKLKQLQDELESQAIAVDEGRIIQDDFEMDVASSPMELSVEIAEEIFEEVPEIGDQISELEEELEEVEEIVEEAEKLPSKETKPTTKVPVIMETDELFSDDMVLAREASAFYSMRRFDDALRRIDKALQHYEDSIILWNMRGNVLRQKNLLEEALESYNKAFELDKNLVVTLANLMSLRYDAGEYDKAYEMCNKILGIRPNEEKFTLWKAILEARSGLIDEAISTLNELLEINDHLEVVWNLKGVLLDSLKRDDEAIFCFERAVDVFPENATAWNNKGVVLFHNEKFEDALNCFSKALKINPTKQMQLNKEETLDKLVKYKGSDGFIRRLEEIKTEAEVVGETDDVAESPDMEPRMMERSTRTGSPSLYMCPSCGVFISDDAVTCEKCGFNFEEDEQERVAVSSNEEEVVAQLMTLSGIGKAKALVLYKAGYRSLDSLRIAPLTDITEIEGINKSLANSIKKQLENIQQED